MADPKMQAPNPPVPGDETPQSDLPVGTFGESPRTSDHQTLVSALKEAFGKKDAPTEPKFGMDYAPDGGRYVVRGQVVDHDGKPVPGYKIVNGEIVKA